MLNSIADWCFVEARDETADSETVIAAIVELTEYGADVELSDGRRTSFWQFATDEPVEELATSWAQGRGATLISVESRFSESSCH